MRSRGGRSFRPGVATVIGVDILEARKLLSEAGRPGDVAEVDRAAAVVSSASERDASARDVGDAAAHADQASARAGIPGGPGAGLAGPAELTPGDERPAGSASAPPVADPPGDPGMMIAAGLAPGVAAAPSDPPSATMVASPDLSPGAGGPPRADGRLSPLPAGADGALLNDDVAAAEPGIARAVRVRLTAGADLEAGAARSGGGGEIAATGQVDEPAPIHRGADLLTDFVPIGREALEDAIDRFLAPLEDLGAELASWPASTSVIPAAAMVVAGTLAAEALRRRIRGGRAEVAEADEDFARFPGHPGPWRWGGS